MENNFRRSALKKLALIHLSLLVLAFCFLFLSKKLTGMLPHRTCLMVKVLKLYCPGCGGTRSVQNLVGFRLKEAFLCYPPLFLGIGIGLSLDAKALYAIAKNNPSLFPALQRRHALLLICGIVLFFILRNAALLLGYDYLGDIIK